MKVGVVEAGPYIDTRSKEFKTDSSPTYEMDIPGLVIPGVLVCIVVVAVHKPRTL